MRKTSMRTGLRITLLCLAGAFSVTTAQAQIDPLETAVRMHSAPDEFYFFDDDRKQVVDYKTERMVRICTGQSRHMVPLKVTYDGKTATIGSNDCIRVEAKEVFLEPSKPLDPNWVIQAEVETM